MVVVVVVVVVVVEEPYTLKTKLQTYPYTGSRMMFGLGFKMSDSPLQIGCQASGVNPGLEDSQSRFSVRRTRFPGSTLLRLFLLGSLIKTN